MKFAIAFIAAILGVIQVALVLLATFIFGKGLQVVFGLSDLGVVIFWFSLLFISLAGWAYLHQKEKESE